MIIVNYKTLKSLFMPKIINVFKKIEELKIQIDIYKPYKLLRVFDTPVNLTSKIDHLTFIKEDNKILYRFISITKLDL